MINKRKITWLVEGHVHFHWMIRFNIRGNVHFMEFFRAWLHKHTPSFLNSYSFGVQNIWESQTVYILLENYITFNSVLWHWFFFLSFLHSRAQSSWIWVYTLCYAKYAMWLAVREPHSQFCYTADHMIWFENKLQSYPLYYYN